MPALSSMQIDLCMLIVWLVRLQARLATLARFYKILVPVFRLLQIEFYILEIPIRLAFNLGFLRPLSEKSNDI